MVRQRVNQRIVARTERPTRKTFSSLTQFAELISCPATVVGKVLISVNRLAYELFGPHLDKNGLLIYACVSFQFAFRFQFKLSAEIKIRPI